MTKYLIRLGSSSQLYTIENGELVNTYQSFIRAEVFEEYGFESLVGVGEILAEQTDTVTLYAWSNDGLVSTSATLIGCPLPWFIETTEVNLVTNRITSVSEITAEYLGNPSMSVQIDSGNWLCYDNGEWVEGRASIATMATVTEEAWAELFENATTLKARVWLESDADSISSFKMTFVIT